MNRKTFFKIGATAFSGLVVFPLSTSGNVKLEKNLIDSKKIEEFVKAGHNDLEKVKDMLLEDPNLIYARHDWGGGDFEEAIEGAGHVGNKQIANYLIEQGARPNLFVLTMLGKKNIVLPALKEFPELIFAKGPHGFSLLHHAKIGGEKSKVIFDFLVSRGLNDLKFEI